MPVKTSDWVDLAINNGAWLVAPFDPDDMIGTSGVEAAGFVSTLDSLSWEVTSDSDSVDYSGPILPTDLMKLPGIPASGQAGVYWEGGVSDWELQLVNPIYGPFVNGGVDQTTDLMAMMSACTEFSLEFFLKVDSAALGGADQFKPLFSVGKGLAVYLNQKNNNLGLQVTPEVGSAVTYYVAKVMTVGVWNHVVITRAAGAASQISAYVNTLVNSTLVNSSSVLPYYLNDVGDSDFNIIKPAVNATYTTNGGTFSLDAIAWYPTAAAGVAAITDGAPARTERTVDALPEQHLLKGVTTPVRLLYNGVSVQDFTFTDDEYTYTSGDEFAFSFRARTSELEGYSDPVHYITTVRDFDGNHLFEVGFVHDPSISSIYNGRMLRIQHYDTSVTPATGWGAAGRLLATSGLGAEASTPGFYPFDWEDGRVYRLKMFYAEYGDYNTALYINGSVVAEFDYDFPYYDLGSLKMEMRDYGHPTHPKARSEWMVFRGGVTGQPFYSENAYLSIVTGDGVCNFANKRATAEGGLFSLETRVPRGVFVDFDSTSSPEVVDDDKFLSQTTIANADSAGWTPIVFSDADRALFD